MSFSGKIWLPQITCFSCSKLGVLTFKVIENREGSINWGYNSVYIYVNQDIPSHCLSGIVRPLPLYCHSMQFNPNRSISSPSGESPYLLPPVFNN